MASCCRPWLERLLSVGIVATDPDIVRRQRCVNVGVVRHVRQRGVAPGLQRGLRLPGPASGPLLQRVDDRAAAADPAPASLRRERRRDGARLADPGRAHVRRLGDGHRPATCMSTTRWLGTFLLLFGVQHWRALPGLLRALSRRAAVCAELRAARRLHLAARTGDCATCCRPTRWSTPSRSTPSSSSTRLSALRRAELELQRPVRPLRRR